MISSIHFQSAIPVRQSIPTVKSAGIAPDQLRFSSQERRFNPEASQKLWDMMYRWRVNENDNPAFNVVAKAKELLAQGADPNFIPDGEVILRPLIAVAVSAEHAELVDLFLDAGAEARKVRSFENYNLFHTLGADKQRVTVQQKGGSVSYGVTKADTPERRANLDRIAKRLRNAGVNIDATNGLGERPSDSAMKNIDTARLAVLANNGANFNYYFPNGFRPLDIVLKLANPSDEQKETKIAYVRLFSHQPDATAAVNEQITKLKEVAKILEDAGAKKAFPLNPRRLKFIALSHVCFILDRIERFIDDRNSRRC